MTRVKMNFIAVFFAVAGFSATVFSCKKENDNADTNIEYNLSGNANGAQEAPKRVTTTATGTISGTYNKNTNILQYTITWNGLSTAPAAMHLHGPADPGIAADVKIPITGFTAGASGTVNRTDTLKNETDEADFLQGRWYYNIHTPANPGGEIRGQIFPTR
jgi:hypothetical protein